MDGGLWHSSSLGEYHSSESKGYTEQLGRGQFCGGFLQDQESCWDATVSWDLFSIELFE